MIKRTILTTTLIFFLATFPSFASEFTGTISTGGSVAPLAPSNVIAAKTGDAQITVTWNASVGADGYKIYRKKNSEDFVLVTTVTTSSYTDSGLGDGTYFYQIQPFLGSLKPNLSDILPAGPVTISLPTPTPTPSPTPAPSGGGGGGGGGGATTTTTPTPGPLSEAAQKVDVNNGGDGKVDVLDFTVLMINWGSTDTGNTADFNDDGTVDILDFTLLMIHWTG